VRPTVGKIGIYDLRRSHVAKMLDNIEDANGPVMADRTRAYFRKALSWHAERDDQFNINSAIVRVASRSNSKDRARTRVLSDYEIRMIWQVLPRLGVFGSLVKMLLFTAQRRDEVARMTYGEASADGVWAIPANRYKTKHPNHIPLPDPARTLLSVQPRIEGCDFVFPSKATTPFSAFNKNKAALDREVEALHRKGKATGSVSSWRLHDLRRTAKTLMQGAGVRPDISERVLGHVIAGVEGTYDRYAYADEKRQALNLLADTIERIVSEASEEPAESRKRAEHSE
jgi:hypothetical protein